MLFRLQCDEWRETSATLIEILEDTRLPPVRRVRSLVHAYLRSEVAEAPYRLALDDAAPFYRDLPETADVRAHVRAALARFIERLDPNASEDARRRAADVFATTLSCLGERFSRQPRTDEEIRAHAETVSDMLCAFTERLAGAKEHDDA